MRFCVFTSAELAPDLATSAIQWWTGADYSHIGIGTCDDSGRIETLYHAVTKGYCSANADEFIADGHAIRGIKYIDVVDEKLALEFLHDLCKKKVPYSKLQLLGFVLPFLQKILDNNEKKLVCSEATAYFYMLHVKNGIDRFEKLNIDFQSPKDVWQIINKGE